MIFYIRTCTTFKTSSFNHPTHQIYKHESFPILLLVSKFQAQMDIDAFLTTQLSTRRDQRCSRPIRTTNHGRFLKQAKKLSDNLTPTQKTSRTNAHLSHRRRCPARWLMRRAWGHSPLMYSCGPSFLVFGLWNFFGLCLFNQKWVATCRIAEILKMTNSPVFLLQVSWTWRVWASPTWSKCGGPIVRSKFKFKQIFIFDLVSQRPLITLRQCQDSLTTIIGDEIIIDLEGSRPERPPFLQWQKHRWV